MGPSDNFTYLLQHLSNVLSKQSERVLRERLGIGLSQYRVLTALEWNPRSSQKAIASGLGQTEASISRQVRAMAADGLLSVKPVPGNRRKSVISATPRGMRLTESARELLRRLAEPGLSGAESRELAAGLQKLHRQICRPGKPGSCGHNLGL